MSGVSLVDLGFGIWSFLGIWCLGFAALPPRDAFVTAATLMSLFDAAYLLALTAWVGSILYFSFGVAPMIFPVLGAEAGGRFVRVLFPRYYAWGATSAAIALPAYVAVPLCYPEYRGPIVGLQAFSILSSILIMLYAGNVLTPAMGAARDAGPARQAAFERLHRRSVWLNAVVLVIGMVLLVAHALRAAPRTAGIIELNPAERARYEAEIAPVIKAIAARKTEFDEAAIRELVKTFARARRPPAAGAAQP